MNATIVIALLSAIPGVGALILGFVNLIAGRGGQRADEASSLTATGMELLHEVEKKCDNCQITLGKVRNDFGAFADVMEELAVLLPPGEPQRKANVAIRAARLASLNPN